MTAVLPGAEAARPAPADGDAAPAPRSGWLVAIAVAGGAYVVLYLVLALLRWRYPYELEWMEGGMVGQVAQLRSGAALYGPPSLTFTPYLYTPLYDVVAGAASLISGLGFSTLRFVSIAASLAMLVGAGRLAALDARDRVVAGVVAAGFLAATYRIGGAWFDLAREDSLALALLLWGLVVARRSATVRSALLAGVLLAGAVMTKQVALLPAAAVAAFLLLARRPRPVVVTYIGTLAVLVGGSTLVLQVATGGWYGYYTLALPSRHELVSSQWVGFFTGDLLRPLPVAVVLGAVALAVLRRDRSEGFWFHLLVGGAIVLAAYSARLHSGGYDNVVIPAYAELAVLFALGADALLRQPRRLVGAAVGLACLAQLIALRYDVGAQLPDGARQRGGDAAVAALASLPQPVYLPGHPWYLRLAGLPLNAQSAAIEDVLRGGGSESDALRKQLQDAIEQQRFGSIVVDSGTGYSYLPDDTCRWYEPAGSLAPGAPLPMPVTGTMTAPETVLVRRATPVASC